MLDESAQRTIDNSPALTLGIHRIKKSKPVKRAHEVTENRERPGFPHGQPAWGGRCDRVKGAACMIASNQHKRLIEKLRLCPACYRSRFVPIQPSASRTTYSYSPLIPPMNRSAIFNRPLRGLYLLLCRV